MAEPHYMPLCACGRTLTDIPSIAVRERWMSRYGDAWQQRPNGTPYWTHCVECHRKTWPNDRRSQKKQLQTSTVMACNMLRDFLEEVHHSWVLAYKTL